MQGTLLGVFPDHPLICHLPSAPFIMDFTYWEFVLSPFLLDEVKPPPLFERVKSLPRFAF